MGLDTNREILIALVNTVKWVFVNLWYWGVFIAILLGIRIYLAKKHKILSADDLVSFVISIIQKDKNQPDIFLNKDTFPKDFIWITPNEFEFGKFGSISFREGNNDNRDIFQLLTDAKGEEVRVQKTANLMDINGNQTRVTMFNLRKRLHKNPKLLPYIDILSTNKGSYKLTIKADILNR